MKRSSSSPLKKEELFLKDYCALKKASDKSSPDFMSRHKEAKKRFSLYQQHSPRHLPLVEHLPVSDEGEKISSYLKTHQVLLLQGATGSGKSTQVPKIVLNAGLSQQAMIAMTQPRRLAAKMIAQRISDETLDPTSTLVGWQVRHESDLSTTNHLKVMTDGILLQEILKDPLLLSYQVVILDEVHERSVNTDLLLGLLKLALAKRTDLKLLLLSAAFDTESLSAYFHDAPVLDIPGKLFPIEETFLPATLEGADKFEKFTWALREARKIVGDILVFLPTEYHIYQYKAFLEKFDKSYEILPLFSRLPKSEIQKVFQPSSKRRLILSTNIAETSLTIDKVTVVICQGFQKISLYDPHLKMTTYPIVPISKLQQVQRRGRCGRTAPGHCFYLYTQEQSEQLSNALLPAIERTSTDQIVLQLLSLGQKTVETFPFYQAPKAQSIKESFNVLKLLRLCDSKGHLTPLGKKVRYQPMEPRLALMLERSKEYGSLSQMVVIVAFFMGQDPRLSPRDALEKARIKHKAFSDVQSDFVTLLNLYQAFESLSHKEMKSFAKSHYLSALHLSFWKKNVKYLRKIHRLKETMLQPFHEEKTFVCLHRALSFGLVDKIFYKAAEGFKGPRGVCPAIDKRSGLKERSAPPWVMAFILERRQDLTINFLGPLEPHFIGQFLEDSLKVVKKPPFLCDKTGFVYQSEDHLLWGLPLRLGKRTLLSASNPRLAREVFIQELFASERWKEYLPSWLATYEQAYALGTAARDLTVLKREEQLQDWAIASWPEEVCSLSALKQYELMLTPPSVEQCFRYKPLWKAQDFPKAMRVKGSLVDIEYLYDHRKLHDGCSLLLPRDLFLAYSSSAWIALVPGLRLAIIRFLLSALPKKLKIKDRQKEELSRELSDSYEFPEKFDTWFLEQCRVYLDPAISYQDLSFLAIPHYLFPFILTEDSEGTIEEVGRLSFEYCALQEDNQSIDLSIKEDLFEHIFESAKSQAYFLPNFEERTVEYLGKNPLLWKVLLKSLSVDYVFRQLPLAKRKFCYDIAPQYRHCEDFLMMLIGSLILDSPFLLQEPDLKSLAQSLENTQWGPLCHLLLEEQNTADKLIAYRKSALKPWRSSFLAIADKALRNTLFLSGLPQLFSQRVGLWVDLLSQISLKQQEKASLLHSFDTEFYSALKDLGIEDYWEENSVLIAVYLEWSLATFLQPLRPIRPLSSKKFLLWARQTDNFFSL